AGTRHRTRVKVPWCASRRPQRRLPRKSSKPQTMALALNQFRTKVTPGREDMKMKKFSVSVAWLLISLTILTGDALGRGGGGGGRGGGGGGARGGGGG